MPGSKTFTSTKSNELLEYDLINEIKSINDSNLQKVCSKITIEFFKLLFSFAITSVLSISKNIFHHLTNSEDAYNLLLMLYDAMKVFIIFLLSYIFIHYLGKFLTSLFNLVFNERILNAKKDNYKRMFYSRTYNMIMLGISFENKSNHYKNNFAEEIKSKTYNEIVKDSNYIDLIVMYLSQSIYYFEVAETDLCKIIPVRMSGKKEKVNLNYINHICISNLKLDLNSSINSLCRLSNLIIFLLNQTNLDNPSFSDILDAFNNKAKKLLKDYRDHYKRVTEFEEQL